MEITWTHQRVPSGEAGCWDHHYTAASGPIVVTLRVRDDAGNIMIVDDGPADIIGAYPILRNGCWMRDDAVVRDMTPAERTAMDNIMASRRRGAHFPAPVYDDTISRAALRADDIGLGT